MPSARISCPRAFGWESMIEFVSAFGIRWPDAERIIAERDRAYADFAPGAFPASGGIIAGDGRR
jgi:hypothetical protein